MVRDRLAVLKARIGDSSNSSGDHTMIEMVDRSAINSCSDHSSEIAKFFEIVEEIKQNINLMQQDVEDVRRTHSSILSAPQTDEKIKNHLESLMMQIKKRADGIRMVLKNMGQEINESAQNNESDALRRIRQTQHNLLSKNFIDVMNDYSVAQTDYRERCKARIQRQLEITGRKTSDQEIEEMIESGNPAIFTQGIDVEMKNARQSLAEIEARHSDIIKLEKSIRELRDMFSEMAILVEDQGAKIDSIENHVLESKDRVEQAYEQTKQALAYQAKARWKKMICLACLIIIIVFICITAYFV